MSPKVSTKCHPLRMSTRSHPFWKIVSTRCHCPRNVSKSKETYMTQILIDTSEIIWTHSGTVGYCVAEKKCNFWACLDSYIMHRYFKISFYFETNIKVISLHYYDLLFLTPPAVFYELQFSWLFDLLSQLATQKYFFPMSFNCFNKIDRKWQKTRNL